MRQLRRVRPMDIGDEFTTRVYLGRTALVPVSAYSDHFVYLRTGMGLEFTLPLWYRVCGGIKISPFRHAILLRENRLRLADDAEVAIEDLGPFQQAKVVMRGDVPRQLWRHDVVAA